jgi:hypothetical protein
MNASLAAPGASVALVGRHADRVVVRESTELHPPSDGVSWEVVTDREQLVGLAREAAGNEDLKGPRPAVQDCSVRFVARADDGVVRRALGNK